MTDTQHTTTEAGTDDGTTPDPQTDASTATENGSQEATTKPEPWDRTLASLPQDVADYIRELRDENKTRRTEADTTRTKLDQVLGALGLGEKQDDDPEALATQATAERDQATAQARDAVRELAIYKAAVKQGADPDALTDSRSFMGQVAALDPADAEFTEKVTAAVKDAVTKTPGYRAAAPTTGAGSADFAGGDTGGEVNAERFAAMTSAERVALFQSNPTLYRRLAG